jgi:hypothetical protein
MKIEIRAKVVAMDEIDYNDRDPRGIYIAGRGSQKLVHIEYELFINDEQFGKRFDKQTAVKLVDLLEHIAGDLWKVERKDL